MTSAAGPTTRNRKIEQGEATRAQLIDVARDLFTAHGFAATRTDEIVRQARVTRGALYHHFPSKEDLFRGVFETLEAEIAERTVRAAGTEPDPLRRLRLGIDAFLDACADPAVQRVVLQEAPTVLGWATWHEIDSKYGFGLLHRSVSAALKAGRIRPQPAEPLAHLLLGAITHAGMVIGQADDPSHTRRIIGQAIQELISSLEASPTPPPTS